MHEPNCQYRKVTPPKQANICLLGRFDGLVTDGMCRLCIRDGLNRPGLGDMVAAGLSAVGITKERVQQVANAVGIKECGCAQRQAALNRLGEKLGLPPGTTPGS